MNYCGYVNEEVWIITCTFIFPMTLSYCAQWTENMYVSNISCGNEQIEVGFVELWYHSVIRARAR